jgi:hypothetical protein
MQDMVSEGKIRHLALTNFDTGAVTTSPFTFVSFGVEGYVEGIRIWGRGEGGWVFGIRCEVRGCHVSLLWFQVSGAMYDV